MVQRHSAQKKGQCGELSGSDGKESARNTGDPPGSIPGSGRSPGGGNGNRTPVFLPGEPTWMEELGGLHSMWSQSVGHNWATNTDWLTVPVLKSISVESSSPQTCQMNEAMTVWFFLDLKGYFMQTWDLGSRFHIGFPFYLNAYRNILWVLPICLLVTLKTLAVICTSHQSPPLIHSELVLDSRWAKMCSNQPAAPRRLWLLPSQAQEPLITCTDVGIGPALETKGWQVLSSPRFGKAVSDFFWNLPGSLRLSASSPSENYLCLIACNYNAAPEDAQATSGVTPLSSHRRSWHVILGPMEQASELNKWSGRDAGFSDGLNLTVKIEARTAKLTCGAGWHHRKPFRWACCRMKVSLWGEQMVDALSVRPHLCLRPRERAGERGSLELS